MKLDIARQPLVPAFLTLAVFTVAAMCSADVTPMDNLAAGVAAGHGGTAAAILHGAAGGTLHASAFAAGARLAVPLPGILLTGFQAACPVWSRWIAGLLILFTGMCAGRLAIRYNLYSVSTCLTIPLYGLTACALAAEGAFLPAFAASALLALSLKNFCRSFCNGYGFDALFRAALYLGLLPLVSPAALPLLLLLPLALALFRRTLREAVVATAGLLLPALTLCYVNWGAGGGFTAPLVATVHASLAGEPLSLFATLPIQTMVLLCGIGALSLLALFRFFSDLYAVGTKPRFILIFTVCAWVLSLLLLAGPAAVCGDTALLAVPAALVMPVFFVRINRFLALTLYTLLLAGALISIIVQ